MKKKILFLFYRTPFNFRFSNDRRQYLIYTTLREKYDVKILTFGEKDEQSDEQQVIEFESSSVRKIIYFLLKLQSPRITHYMSRKFRNEFAETLLQFQPDFIYVEHFLMMQYVMDIETSAKIILYDDDSIMFMKASKRGGSIYQKLRNIGLAQLEKTACLKSNRILTITNEEKEFLREKDFHGVTNIPYGINADYFSFNWNKPKVNSILFVGDFSHYPNREAVKLLGRKIMPALSKFEIILKIVGRNGSNIKKYLPENAKVYENVEDVRDYYYNSSIFVVPIFSGAGLRVKILEAALCGIPMVTTLTANLGINFVNGEEAFIRNTVKDVIECIKSYFDLKFNRQIDYMRRNARNRIVSEFSEDKLKQRILNVFEETTC